MPFEWWIGWRYVRRQRHGKGGFVSFIALASMLGMTLGVAALIVVLSVMNGFQEELRARILGVAAHLEVTGSGGMLAAWQPVAQQLRADPEVVATAPFVAGQALATHGGVAHGVMVRGVLPEQEAQVGAWQKFVKAGSLDTLTPGAFHAAIGIDLARQLGIDLGDSLVLIAPDAMLGPTGLQPRMRAFRVAAIFDSGMYEFDSGLVLLSLADAQAFFRMGDAVTGIRIRLTDPLAAPRKVREWAPKLPAGLWLSDWTSRHANFFRAVQLEKTMMTLILFLIVAVAAFNLVSTLVMSVQDKHADIAILRTIGAAPVSILAIFVVQGAAIGVIGLSAGTVLGLWLAHHVSEVVAFLEAVTGATLWNKEVYFISDLPSKVLASDVALVVGVSFALTLLATLYPSWRAAHVQPAEALRHE
ncbi:lipoprotein-releasing ABC transporter permease subunit [Hydrogenophilus thiooxidans]|uniref:lipoprotein-releasing ABC transporter permease subunit n=1 Tax=Hydrogenophilus thiooxidans TaxID=2820326 RepID=UPI001C222B8D|nr:lipoprotein-releasing ABC transporter permease subunit [Hydrogenophilus thiooxidans]